MLMTPDEIVKKLHEIGANVSRRTLLHYEEAGLIPLPERGGGGRKGRFTNYPEWTTEEAFAAWSLIHGKYSNDDISPQLSPALVRKIRNLSLNTGEDLQIIEPETSTLYEIGTNRVVSGFAALWQAERLRARALLLENK